MGSGQDPVKKSREALSSSILRFAVLSVDHEKYDEFMNNYIKSKNTTEI